MSKSGWSVLFVLAAACSGGGDSGDDASQPSSEDSSSTPTSSATMPSNVPAGVQYSDPIALSTTPRALAVDGDTWLVVGTTPTTDEFCQQRDCYLVNDPIALVGNPVNGFEEVRIDNTATYPPVPDFAALTSFEPTDAVKGASGWVVTGRLAALSSDSDVFVHTVRSVVWFSADALTWERIDLRDVVGSDQELTINSVIADEGGYLAVGSVAPQGFDRSARSRGVVLSSTDGRAWVKAAELPTTFDSLAEGIRRVGPLLVVDGEEWVCGRVSLLFSGPYGEDFRQLFWASADGGSTWDHAKLSGVEMFAEPAGMAATQDECATVAEHDHVDTRAGFVDAAGETLVVGSGDGTTVLATEGLTTWRSATLVGGASDDPEYRRAMSDGDALLIVGTDRPLSLSFDDGRRLAIGYQPFAWRSTDGGASWVEIKGSYPAPGDDLPVLHPQSGGTVIAFVGATALVSSAGELKPPPECSLESGGSCTFSVIEAEDLGGTNLAAIDFTGSVFRGANLVGANLSGANLTGVEFVDADLTGANLSGANLTGATLRGIWRDVNLSGADVTESYFRSADFTGADFSGVILAHDEFADGPILFQDVICPDGLPRDDPDAYIADASSCRIQV